METAFPISASRPWAAGRSISPKSWPVRTGWCFYRGAWCPYCNAQLASFSRASDQLANRGAQVVALSVDDEATSADLADKHGIRFRLGHSADADKVAATTGAFTNDDPVYLQSTGFVLGPDGQILTAVYSSGAIGRLAPDDVIGFIDHTKSQA